MKLLKLSSNNSKFKTLEFKDGLNILAGLQLTEAEKKTYNGIGKSFSLHLIHLMLGSSLDKSKPKEKKVLDFLCGYGAFYLEFEHQGESFKVEKNFAESHYILNDERIAKTNFSGELRRILIGGTFDTSVSFKQLLNTFARRYGSTYYSDVLSQQGRPLQDYYQMYANLALLGVDTGLVCEKAIIKDKLNKLEKAKSVIEGYESLLGESNIKDLQDELVNLIKEKKEFIIAENYDKYKREADEATVLINQIRNEIYDVTKGIGRKKESLNEAEVINIDLDKVKRIYDEALFFFNEKVSVRLEQANEFHQNLVRNRTQRVNAEISELKIKLDELENQLSKREVYRDSILKDLDSKGALEEYNSINDRIRSLEGEVRELDKYRKILQSFKADKSQYDLDNANVKAKAVSYLTTSQEYFENIENKFRSLVKRFYTNHGGSFQVSETVDAKYLFNIDVQVPRDGSQGINEVKIFCYDFLLYQLRPELLSFIAHDGCIFSEMDPRQKSMIFKVAIETIENSELQYFVNMGQSSLDEILDVDDKLQILSSSEKAYVKESVILKLFDKDPSNWLFGTSFG
jgi:uncharacterized protein YydD (DUF2326 family)